MSQPIYNETKAQLVAAAKAQGHCLSERQITRWHASGLLPRPKQVPALGVGGSETYYPAGTVPQLVALAEIHKNFKSLADIGWELWWQGYPVEEKYWTLRLSKQIQIWVDTLSAMLETDHANGGVEFSDVFFGAIEQLKSARIKNRYFRHFRRRIGQKDFETALITIFGVAAGTLENIFSNSDSDDFTRDIEILDKTLGLKRARTDRLQDQIPWLSGDISSVLVSTSKIISGKPLNEILEATPRHEIISARDQLRLIISKIGSAAQNREAQIGKHAFGLGVVGELFRGGGADFQALMLILLLSLKTNSDFYKSIDDFVKTLT